MTEEEADNLLYMINEEINLSSDIYGIKELVYRIKLVKSGAVPEFVEEY